MSEELYVDRLGSMSVEEACRWILGRDIAESIINHLGIKWAVVAAMAEATINDNHEAVETLRKLSRL